jgi:hypothetical protein
VDYLDEDASKPTASTVTPEPEAADLDLDTELAAVSMVAADIDPFLLELMPEDRNARRRVVTALLRAVLSERKIT